MTMGGQSPVIPGTDMDWSLELWGCIYRDRGQELLDVICSCALGGNDEALFVSNIGLLSNQCTFF